MKLSDLKKQPWFSSAVAICLGVVLYLTLTHLSSILGAVGKFIGFFSPVLLGCVIAYMVNPLAKFIRGTVFKKMQGRHAAKAAAMSNTLAFILVILLLVFALATMIPQLVESMVAFAGNLPGYIRSLEKLLSDMGAVAILDKLHEIAESTEKIVETVTNLVKDNLTSIIQTSATAGKSVATFVLALILSIYLLAEKNSLMSGLKRFFTAVMRPERYEGMCTFLRRCDAILNRYIVFNMIDSLIVGVVNAVFMIILRMPYIGLVSFIVALFNLIPTFGPIIGAVIAAFILLLVRPWYARAFLIFTAVLQTLDGYVIKPKLFGDSLGVSGLWILIGIVVGGRMFGVVGILLAIPVVAILDFMYSEYFLAWLERRKAKAAGEDKDAPDSSAED